jgi:hypothetical protein
MEPGFGEYPQALDENKGEADQGNYFTAAAGDERGQCEIEDDENKKQLVSCLFKIENVHRMNLLFWIVNITTMGTM